MLNASMSSGSVTLPQAGQRLMSTAPLGGDALYMLLLRFIAHLPYLKVASVLALPQGISNGGLLAAALVNALACFAASRWSAGLRRNGAELPHRAVLPLLGTTAVFIILMLAVPAIATLSPRHPDRVADVLSLLPGCVLMVAPVCAVFFAAQFLTVPSRTTRR